MRNLIASILFCSLLTLASFGQNQTLTKSLTMKVVSKLDISTATLPAGVVGVNYSATLVGTGGVTPYKWSSTNLPSWLALNADTGVLSSAPIPLTACTGNVPCPFTFTVTLTDSTSQISQLEVDGAAIASSAVLILDQPFFDALP